MDSTYYANLSKEDIGSKLYEKVTSFYEEIERNGRLAIWRKVHRYYYALNEKGAHEASAIRAAGEQGELSALKANHYRNLLQHLHVLVTQQRPSFDCRAVNTDVKSQVQTILGKNILEYYQREKRMDSDFRHAAEVAITYSEAYVETEWDKDLGDAYAGDTESGQIIKTGDIAVRVHEPINVVRACYSDKDKQNWYILRRWMSRYEVAAKYPDQAEAILKHSESMASEKFYYYNYSPVGTVEQDQELIPVYTYYHDRTAACPTGRRVVFLGSDIVLEYDVLRYPVMPVFPMIPSRQHGTSFGYSVSFDLLCVQEAIDLLYSTILSNQSAFGVQNIWMKPGSNLVANQLGGGLNILESSDKPEAINLTQTPVEIFNFLKGLEGLGQILSGVNSVARGQPEASLKSGAALALVASQAVQFSNGLQAAYARLLEDTGTSVLRTLQTRATLPRAAVIAGKNNKSNVRFFTGDDIKSINRVIVDLGNPMSRTIAGRIQMADSLLANQVLTRPEQYVQIIETGSLDPAIEDGRNEELLMADENEALREGRPVIAMVVDKHVEHIQSHGSVLSGTEERMDPELVKRVTAHIQEHIQALRTTDPALLNVLGQAPIAVQPNGAPTPPQGANAPQPNGQPQPGEQVPAPAGSAPAVAANMPTLPSDPNQQVPGMSPAA